MRRVQRDTATGGVGAWWHGRCGAAAHIRPPAPLRMALVLAALVPAIGCSADRAPAPSAEPVTAAAWFTDRAAAAGLSFVHVNGASGRFYYPEILPPGVALLDYDGDGDLDAYVAQGHALAASPGPAAAPAEAQPRVAGRLYRNDLRVRSDGARDLRFTDVTAASGLSATGYGLGVATGDIDNDGRVDLYLTTYDGCRMYRNNGDGTFTDVTAASGTANPGALAVSAAFVDVDRDGWLDLYVANNVNYRTDNRTVCPGPAGAPDYCPPQIYGGLPDRLYRNLGRGRFADVTRTALLGGTSSGPGLGVATADFDGDGWLDILVANDGEPNLLWLNQRNGTLRDVGLEAGVAVTAEGRAEASMGVDAGDFDNDGDEDIVVTELTGQGTNLYVNDGSRVFRDVGAASGIGAQSLAYTGWGTAWIDYDNDGWLDLLAVNGTIIAQEGRPASAFPYDQKKLLFRNLANGRFQSVGGQAGAVFDLSESGRGAAFGDIDNDGDMDVLVGNNSGPLRLLVNEIGTRNHWLGLRLVSGDGRDLLGARVSVVRDGQPTLWRRARSDGSYASANDPRVLVGLGPSAAPALVQVRWPDGRDEHWPVVPIDAWTTLRQGTGR